MISIPEHYRRVQTMEQQEVSNFLGLQSTPFQTSEQGKASYTPAHSHGKKREGKKGVKYRNLPHWGGRRIMSNQ